MRACRRKEEQRQALLLGCVPVPTMRVTQVQTGAAAMDRRQLPQLGGVVLQTVPLRVACAWTLCRTLRLTLSPRTMITEVGEFASESAVGPVVADEDHGNAMARTSAHRYLLYSIVFTVTRCELPPLVPNSNSMLRQNHVPR